MPYSPKRLLLSVEKVSTFFKKYPNALGDADFKVNGKSIPDTFHDLVSSLRKEIGESKTASESHSQIQKDIKELSRSLRILGSDLEDALNALLTLGNEPDKHIHLVRTKNDLADFQNFSNQMKDALPDAAEGEFVQKKATEFDEKLGAYDQSLAKIGDAEKLKVQETIEAENLSVQNRALAAALVWFCRRYLRGKNPELYREFDK